MDAVEITHGRDTHVPEFVFQVLCARARRRFGPLDRATMRGLLVRCGLRIQDLLHLSPKPVSLINEDEGTDADHDRVSAMFTYAVQRHIQAIEDGDSREAFLARMSAVVLQLHAHTPYRYTLDTPSDTTPLDDPDSVDLADHAGDPLEGQGADPADSAPLEGDRLPDTDRILAELRASLPELPQVGNPARFIEPTRPPHPNLPRPRSRPTLFKLPPHRSEEASVTSILAVLEGDLDPLPTCAPPPDPSPARPAPLRLGRPDTHKRLQAPVLPPLQPLMRANLDSSGRDLDRWLSLPGLIIGAGGAVIGTWLIVEGLVGRSVALGLAGMSFVLVGFAFDFVIELVKGLRARKRQSLIAG